MRRREPELCRAAVPDFRTGHWLSIRFVGRLIASLLISVCCVLSESTQTPLLLAQERPAHSGREDDITDRKAFLGSSFPEDLAPLLRDSEARQWLHKRRIKAYGWVDGGFTYSSTGSGLLTVAPSSNRFGNEFLLNGAWLIVARLPEKEGLSYGFRVDFQAGADAALLRPLNNFGPQGNHVGTDLRQAYLSLHTPGLNSHGIDWTLGRQNIPIGFETLMAPYRPMYSETYFWIKYQVGSTAAIATIHPNGNLDLVGGVVMGYNTVFELRGRAPAYLVRAVYRPSGTEDTQFIATVFTGPQPAATTAGHIGSWQTVSELEARRVWTPRIAQVAQVHYAVDQGDPMTKRDSATQGAFLVTAFKVDPKLYLNTRAEWFADPHGVRTGSPGTFSEATLGLNYLPVTWINFRPEVRGDFAGQSSYHASLGDSSRRNQLTVAFDLILKFDAW